MLKMIEDWFTIFTIKENENDIIRYIKFIVNMTFYIIMMLVVYVSILIPFALVAGIPVAAVYYVLEII